MGIEFASESTSLLTPMTLKQHHVLMHRLELHKALASEPAWAQTFSLISACFAPLRSLLHCMGTGSCIGNCPLLFRKTIFMYSTGGWWVSMFECHSCIVLRNVCWVS